MKTKVQFIIAVIFVVMLFFAGKVLAEKPEMNASWTYSFLPMIKKDAPQVISAPTHTLYVFSTNATTTGNGGGRAGMNAVCSSEDVNSHFCTRNEIETAMMSTGVYFKSPFLQSWIDNITYYSYVYNGQTTNVVDWSIKSCNGWNNAGIGIGSTNITNDGAGISSPGDCSVQNHVSCCKFIP